MCLNCTCHKTPELQINTDCNEGVAGPCLCSVKLTKHDKAYLKFISEMLINLKFHERHLRRKWGNINFDDVYYSLQHDLSALLEHIAVQNEWEEDV